MKNGLILLYLVFCGVASGQIIDFPDANFKNALVGSKCVDTNGDGVGDADADLNNDGEIDVNEAINVTVLLVWEKKFQILKGLDIS